ncbi:MAG TPA: dihydroxyacetone kinase subunit L [Candidatus Gallacutalibacter pullistercoris]|nr:dihydroxyacetone kinase subunit L [Candidatus Gallacutalibacter pullistercoris]
MNAENVHDAMSRIAEKMEKSKDLLVKLDQQNGDGDLGLSMASGFAAVAELDTKERDLGRLFMIMARKFNECAPSSLGTILSFGMMGMAQALRGHEKIDIQDLVQAMHKGLENIMGKAGSKPGEKTILDALYPAVAAMDGESDAGCAFQKAAAAAAEGSERTRQMRAVHGRAAYYGDKSIGILDGGSVVGRLIFETLADKDTFKG